MTQQSALLLTAYAPALVTDDGRTLAVLQAMERALPGLRLEWEISEEGQPIALRRRDTWLAEAAALGEFPLVCNGDESCPVTVHGLRTSARQAPGGQPLLDVHAKLPLDETVIKVASDILEGIADGAQSFWGHATPGGAALDIVHQTSPTLGGPPRPPRGLPALKLFKHIRAPQIPYYLGWLNYWSAASARALGFPDPARDAELLSRSRRTATGGWVVRLTEAPLDLDDPTHLEALLRAYERFPEVGGRSTP